MMRTMLPSDISAATPMRDGAGELARRLAAWSFKLEWSVDNRLGSGISNLLASIFR